MLLFIFVLMLTAVSLEIFCFSQLSTMRRPDPKPKKKPVAEKPEAKKTRLGRPIQIVQIKV